MVKLLLLLVLALAGCPGAHTGYPDKSCTATSECLVGEVCSDLACTPIKDLGP
jgi:hypothetical protein